MNDDDRLSRHLAASADAITLTPADPAAAVRRGTRRRNRRRAAIGGVAAVAVAATTFSVLDRQPTPVDSDLAAAGVVASPFDWTVVEPATGLGYSRSATLADGSLYSLSTAPGPYDEQSSFEPHLYRSADGAEWAEVSLPDDMRASSIATDGGSLYAIGTAPATIQPIPIRQAAPKANWGQRRPSKGTAGDPSAGSPRSITRRV